MAATPVYPFVFPFTDSTAADSLSLAQALSVPSASRVRLTFDATPYLDTVNRNQYDPPLTDDSVLLRIFPEGGGAFGAGENGTSTITNNKPIAGDYTLPRIRNGFTLTTNGTGLDGTQIARVYIHPALYTDIESGGDFGLYGIALQGRLVVSGPSKGKPGYKRTRFSS